MEKRKVEKNKFIIYNEDKKVLAFTSVSSKGFRHVSIPGIILNGYKKDSTSQFYDSIIGLLVEEGNLCYLDSIVTEGEIFTTENRKLKKQILQTTRNYYSCYKEFTKKDCESVIKLCYEANVIPEFISIAELIMLINKERHENLYDIEEGMKEPLQELDKRLKFIKY